MPDLPVDIDGIVTQLDADRHFALDGALGKMLGKTIDAGCYVPIILFAKIVRSAEGIRILLPKRFATEAGTVTLSAFEAKLDMLFIGTDAPRGDTWLGHQDPVHQPWSVQSKLDSIYTKGTPEHTRQQGIFRDLSAINIPTLPLDRLDFLNGGQPTFGKSAQADLMIQQKSLYRPSWPRS